MASAHPPFSVCRLCTGPLTASQVESGFCCEGCARVSEILDASGFDGDRTESAAFIEAARTGIVPVDGRPPTARETAAASTKDARKACLAVEGLWCPSCAWLVESVLDRTPGVLSSRITFFADLAEVSFDPKLIDEAKVAEKIEGLGYRVKQAGDRPDRGPLLRFGVAMLLQMNVMWFSYALYAHGLGGGFDQVVEYLPWLIASLSFPVVFVTGWPMFVRAWQAAKARALVMDSLIVLAATAAWVYSLVVAVKGSWQVYFDTASGLITFRLLGRLLEQAAFRSVARAGEAVRRLLPKKARRIEGDGISWAPVEALVPGQQIRVAPGERVPLDGRVIVGTGRVSTAVVDGEPRPRAVRPGDLVPGGSVCGETALDLVVTAPAAASLLSRVADHVARASGRRGSGPEVADAIARVFIPGVFVLSAVTFAAWRLAGLAPADAFERALAVLVVSCPCALGIAAPLCRVVAAGSLARRGIIVRAEGALDQVAAATGMAFDKTGTLTAGRPTLIAIEVAGAATPDALATLAGLEERAGHPIAHAVREVLPSDLVPAAVEEFRSVPGCGVTGQVAGAPAWAGKPDWVEGVAGDAPAVLREVVEREQGQGRTAILLAWGPGKWAALSFGDPLRSEAPAALGDLHALGLRTTILSGDNARAAARVAQAVGVKAAVGDCLPEDKAAWLEKEAAASGRRLVFVGDGINDAPGLAASIGVAVASGTDFARETADVLLLEPGLAPLAPLVRTSRRMRAIIRQNLAWAALYNAALIPLAAFGRMTPIWAAAAMVASGLIVVVNALRLQGRSQPLALTGTAAAVEPAARSTLAAA